MSIHPCCLKAFQWNGTPTGRVGKLANNDAYITGTNPDAAILFIADILGWTFPNARLLADHLAREADATVYVPDFFGGEVVPPGPVLRGAFHELDMTGYAARNSREVREPEMVACAKALRQQLGFKRVGAVGYCYGGWGCFRLGAKLKGEAEPLVDCISVGHPSWLVERDVDEVAVPVQVLAPEHDPAYTAELKRHTFETVPRLGVPFEYHHFPGVEHGCLVRGDESVQGERAAMVRAKNAAVHWLTQFLH